MNGDSGKAVRDAMVKASAGNVRTCVWMDESTGKYWTSAPVPDVKNVLEELARLQDVESRLRAQHARLGRVLSDLNKKITEAANDGYYYGTNGANELRERAMKIRSDLSMIEEVLHG